MSQFCSSLSCQKKINLNNRLRCIPVGAPPGSRALSILPDMTRVVKNMWVTKRTDTEMQISMESQALDVPFAANFVATFYYDLEVIGPNKIKLAMGHGVYFLKSTPFFSTMIRRTACSGAKRSLILYAEFCKKALTTETLPAPNIAARLKSLQKAKTEPALPRATSAPVAHAPEPLTQARDFQKCNLSTARASTESTMESDGAHPPPPEEDESRKIGAFAVLSFLSLILLGIMAACSYLHIYDVWYTAQHVTMTVRALVIAICFSLDKLFKKNWAYQQLQELVIEPIAKPIYLKVEKTLHNIGLVDEFALKKQKTCTASS